MVSKIVFNKKYEVFPMDYSNPMTRVKRWKEWVWKDRGFGNPRERVQVAKEMPVISLFKKGLEIKFREGLNVIVGENGTGKTQLFNIIASKGGNDCLYEDLSYIDLHVAKNGNAAHVDIEKHHDGNITPDPRQADRYTEDLYRLVNANTSSHGEKTINLMSQVLTDDSDMIFLDEPEQGLSLKNQILYFHKIQKMAETKQVFVITHSKHFVELVDEVYDFDRHEWLSSTEYLKRIERWAKRNIKDDRKNL